MALHILHYGWRFSCTMVKPRLVKILSTTREIGRPRVAPSHMKIGLWPGDEFHEMPGISRCIEAPEVVKGQYLLTQDIYAIPAEMSQKDVVMIIWRGSNAFLISLHEAVS